MKKILAIIGARPQFIKHKAFLRAAVGRLQVTTLHTGQHYDSRMSTDFWDGAEYTLTLKATDGNQRLEEMIQGIREYIPSVTPDAILVYGDTDSTLAGARAASTSGIPLIHVEAGLRSQNPDMVEEVNRIETDRLSDILFCPSETAIENLANEGITHGVYLTGDLMKDLLLEALSEVKTRPSQIVQAYVYVSLHRPYNVDTSPRFKAILEALDQLEEKVIFTLHPRSKNKMADLDIRPESYTNIHFIPAQNYEANLSYMLYSKCIVTDSGGMQKEAYWLEKKCITLRSETEWPETLDKHCHALIFDDLSQLAAEIHKTPGQFDPQLYGDGNAGEKMVKILVETIGRRKVQND